TGFKDLDRKLGGGLRAGDLIIVAGRPSMGKSALAFQIGEHVAQAGYPVLVLSMEMSRQQVLDRVAAGEARIPLEAILKDGAQAAKQKMEGALDRIAEWPLYIDDSAAVSVQ